MGIEKTGKTYAWKNKTAMMADVKKAQAAEKAEAADEKKAKPKATKPKKTKAAKADS